MAEIVMPPPSPQSRPPTLVARVLEALGQLGPSSPLEVAQALGEDRTRVRKALRYLFLRGRVRRTGYGVRYTLARAYPSRYQK